ncbi:MAG: hypothetical protein QOC92_344 [Acidimicrobiaceae bacterium]
MRKLIIAGLSAGILMVVASPASAKIPPTDPPTGCVASSPNAAGEPTGQLPASATCTFTGDGTATNGYVGVTDGGFTITHVQGTLTVTDVNAAAGPANGGPGTLFTSGVEYTVTVLSHGTVAAGDADQRN